MPDGYNMFDDAQGTKKELGYIDNGGAKIYHRSRKGLHHAGIFKEKVGRTRSSLHNGSDNTASIKGHPL